MKVCRFDFSHLVLVKRCFQSMPYSMANFNTGHRERTFGSASILALSKSFSNPSFQTAFLGPAAVLTLQVARHLLRSSREQIRQAGPIYSCSCGLVAIPDHGARASSQKRNVDEEKAPAAWDTFYQRLRGFTFQGTWGRKVGNEQQPAGFSRSQSGDERP